MDITELYAGISGVKMGNGQVYESYSKCVRINISVC